MILLCYDGSADAQAAIDQAARLMPGVDATVLTIWEPFAAAMIHGGAMGGLGMAGAYADNPQIDEDSRHAALGTATEGARRASAAGLAAEPRIAGRQGGVGQAILAAAADVDAAIVVLGTRGLGGVKSFLLGSVSHEVVQHADRAVLVVPSPGLAEQRGGWARQTEAAVGAA